MNLPTRCAVGAAFLATLFGGIVLGATGDRSPGAAQDQQVAERAERKAETALDLARALIPAPAPVKAPPAVTPAPAPKPRTVKPRPVAAPSPAPKPAAPVQTPKPTAPAPKQAPAPAPAPKPTPPPPADPRYASCPVGHDSEGNYYLCGEPVTKAEHDAAFCYQRGPESAYCRT